MKTLSIVFDKDLELSEEIKNKSSQEITYLVIRTIILSYATSKRGLDEEERRKYYKICDAFEKALKVNNGASLPEQIELDDDWVGFIRKCKKEAPLMPDKLLQKIEGIIDEIKDR